MTDDAARVAAVRPTPLLVTSVTATALSFAWLLTSLPASWSPAAVGWIFPLVAVGCAPLAAHQAAGTAGIPAAARRFWLQLLVASVFVGLGTVFHAQAASLGPDAPTQRIAPSTTALYLVGVLIVIFALLRLPGSAALSPVERRRFWLDAVIVVTTTGLFAWHVAYSRFDDWRLMTRSSVGILAVVLLSTIAVLAFVKVGLIGTGAVDRRAMHTLALGAALGCVTGSLAPLLASRPDLNSAMLSVSLATLGLVLGADRQRRAAGVPAMPVRRRRPFSVVPYTAVAATDALLIGVAFGGGTAAVVIAIGAVVLSGVVVYRQIIAFTDNSRLLRRVDATVLELQDAQQQLAHQASHDDLTGLPNRRLFEERTSAALADGTAGCVVLVDLDDFKAVNDRHGHVLGDALLVVVGRRLLACVRPDDTVARFGGDEFALLLRDVSADAATGVLDRIVAALEQPISVGGHDLLVQCGIGTADAVPGLDSTELLRRADLAMFAAKDRGKGGHARYDPAFDRQAANDAQLGAELRQALDRGEFHLLYQPVVRLPGGRPAGAEALVRWQHPDRGLVSPDLFISVAERTGLIIPLGGWILNEACRQAGQWLRGCGATQPWKVSVNISARQLREPGFAGDVAAALRAADLPAERLMVEVTETAVFDNGPAVEELTEISELGVSVALDDFGTGHSSLGLLRTTPVDVLKVDKSFVDGITGGTEEAVIATALIHIAEGLHLGAVAEGVETLAQAQRLHELGYRLAQGYYFARPLPPAEVGEILAGEARLAVAPELPAVNVF